MRYNYYKTDNTIETIESDKPLELKKLQELVGGHIEAVELRNGNTLFVNEEGFLQGLPQNPHFSESDVYVNLTHSGGRLLGNVIEGKMDDEGEFIGVENGK